MSKFKNFGLDKNKGIQKIHQVKSFRIGGLLIFISIFIVGIILISDILFWLIFICLIPTFLAGLYEDIYQNSSVKTRLFAIILTSLLLIYFTETIITNVDITWFNEIIKINYFAIIFTLLGITATSNAFNFIDGVNGLSSGLGVLVLLTISHFSYQNNLFDLSYFLIIYTGVIFGFFIINIFTGKIFLGDTGSYLIGIIIAWSGLYISSNDAISSWVIFLMIIYPASELIITVIRRILDKKSPFKPDSEHIHSLIYKVNFKCFKNYNNKVISSISGIITLFLSSIPILTAVIFFENTNIIILCSFFFFFFYLFFWYCLKKMVIKA